MRIYLNTMGYGLAVIGKLKETKIKRNLYYEVKEKVVEETTIGNRIVKSKKVTRVYGLQSSMEVRNGLVELLRERMNYHKDKFISPTIYNELRGLEVTKSGRLDHSVNGHDDQIFSYLMAIYVWYCGKNLRENFGIEKGAIKTEEDVDEVLELDSAAEVSNISKQLADINTSDDSDAAKLKMQMALMQKAQGVMYADFINKQRAKEEQMLGNLLRNPEARKAYARKYQIPEDSVSLEDGTSFDNNAIQKLPDSLFLDFNKDEEELGQDSIYNSLSVNNGLVRSGSNQRFPNYEDNGLQ